MSDRKKPYSQDGQSRKSQSAHSTGTKMKKNKTDSKKVNRTGAAVKRSQGDMQTEKSSQTQMNSGASDGILDKRANEKKMFPFSL